jgi:hypothetical protein
LALLPHLLEHIVINVTKRHNFAMPARVVGVTITLAADANAGELNLVIGRRGRGASKRRRPFEQHRRTTHQGRLLQEISTIHRFLLRVKG